MKRQLQTYLLSLVIFACAPAAFASGELPGFYQDTGINPFHAPVSHTLDENIDPFTGRLQLHHIDATFKGNGGFDLVLQRSYNSSSRYFGTTSDPISYNRTPNVGVGWRLLIGGRVFNAIGGTGTACAGGNQMAYEAPDGHFEALIRASDGTFISPSRWHAVCNGSGVQVWSPGGMRYDMYQAKGENVPSTIGGSTFLYPTHVEDRNGNFANFTYSADANILLNQIATSDGRTITFGYTQIGILYMLTSVGTPSGTWTYAYDTTNPATIDGSGHVTSYFLIKVQPPSGDPWQYAYYYCGGPPFCSLGQVIYPTGGDSVYTYTQVDFKDGMGLTPVVSTKQRGGYYTDGTVVNTWTYTYAPGSSATNNDVTTVAAPTGTITYEHVGALTVGTGSTWQIGLLQKRTYVDQAAGLVQTDTYAWTNQQISPYPTIRTFGLNDGVTYAPLMTQHVISRGGTTYTTNYSNFDAYGNPGTIAEIGQRSHTITRSYYTNVSPTTWIVNIPGTDHISGLGDILRSFDGRGNLLSENRFGVATSYAYNADGSLGSKSDANNHSTSYGVYQNGVPLSESRPAGVTINRTVDIAGNITSQTDGAGNNYQYTYDGLRRLLSKTPPTNLPTTVAWTGSTQRTATRGTYVETLQFTGVEEPWMLTRDGVQTLMAYDAMRNKLLESYPGAVELISGKYSVFGTTFAPDILGRVAIAKNADTTTHAYSYFGSALSDQDENHKTKTYHFDAFGDPDKHFLTAVDLADGSTQSIGRDDLGNITSVTMGSLTRTYGYNGSYFLTSITDPETGTTTFGRDNVGNMTSKTVGGKTTQFTYDGLNRLTQIAYPSSGTVTIAYLGNGRTSSVTNPQATRNYAYDANANLTSETLTVGSQVFTITYTYNGNDALSTITYPGTNEVVAFNPDNQGRPTTAGTYITAITYFPDGNTQSMVYGNGTMMGFQESLRMRPTTFAAGPTPSVIPSPPIPPFVFMERYYVYDPVGNVTTMTDVVDSAQSMQMGYDANYRLTSVTGAPWINAATPGSVTMSYDAVGNLTSYNTNTNLLSYNYGSDNKLASVNARLFTYDGYGNVTSDGYHTYQYDDASNLTCVDCGTGNQISYAYDGNNRRVSRTQGGATTYYVHASNGDLLLEYTPSTHKGTQHIYVHGKRIASKPVTF